MLQPQQTFKMDQAPNGESIVPSNEQREEVVYQSLSLWQSLFDATHLEQRFAAIPNLSHLHQVPSFTKTRHRAHTTSTKAFLLAKGTATWSTTDRAGCKAISSLGESGSASRDDEYISLAETRDLEQSFLLGLRQPTSCCIDEDHGLGIWPGEEGETHGEGNYLAVLTLAWTYVLSSLWAESQNGEMLYTDEQAPVVASTTEDSRTVAVCSDCPAATRWWSAVLAPGQGWTASITVDDIRYQAPWAVKLGSKAISAVCGPSSPTVEIPGSYQSFTYIMDFCLQHSVMGQAKAALAAALMFPSHAHFQIPLALPAPTYIQPHQDAKTSQLRSQELENIFQILPHLMTISSVANGLTTILCSVFFEPSIPCNLSSEWLEPLFSVITPADTRHIAAMCMLRSPSIGGWWLGSAITGLYKYILQEARSGVPLINLPSWWWTQLPQSYICFPCPEPADDDGHISRQKEAMLLYLSEKAWSYTPPWKPPGKVTVEGTHIVVREHAHCSGHALSYKTWSWLGEDNIRVVDMGYSSSHRPPAPYERPAYLDRVEPVDLENMSEEASKQCSRMILWGLWKQGVATKDRMLYRSLEEWIGMSMESEDSESDGSGDSEPRPAESSEPRDIRGWLAGT